MATTSRLSEQQADDADRRRLIIEDVEWLTDCGEHPENVLRRLAEAGYVYASVDTLVRVLEKWDRASLARRLTRERMGVA